MSFIPVLLYIAAWALAITVTVYEQGDATIEIIRSTLLFSVGLQSLITFFALFFFTKKDSSSEETILYKRKVAMAKLGYGVLGVLCFWFESMWIPTALGVSLYYLGCAYIKIQESMEKRTNMLAFFKPINYIELLVPLTLWLAMLFYYV